MPPRVLTPIILMFCIIGSFAITNNEFAIWIMFAGGVLGWILESNDFPVAPIILGLVLGEMLEQNFMTSMIKSDGSVMAFFTRPIAGVLGVLTLLVWGYLLFQMLRPAFRSVRA